MDGAPAQENGYDHPPVIPPPPNVPTVKSPFRVPGLVLFVLLAILLPAAAAFGYFYVTTNKIESRVININGDRGKMLFLVDYPLSPDTLEQVTAKSQVTNWEIDILPLTEKMSVTEAYDFVVLRVSLSGEDSPSLAKFLQQKETWGNTPLVVFIQGKQEVKLDKFTQLLSHSHMNVLLTKFIVENNQTDEEAVNIDLQRAIEVIEKQKKNNDAKRINQFISLFTSINDYYVNQTKLPQSLSDPVLDPARVKDPITNTLFDYSVRSGQFFRLCADFSWDFSKYPNQENYPYFSHKKGKDCYYFNAQTDPMKKFKNRENVLPSQEEILDRIRLKDLVDLSSAVNGYFRSKHQLPIDFQSFTSFIAGAEMQDPVTNEQYSYSKVSDTDFDFCAVFSTDSPPLDSMKDVADIYNKKIHKKGRDCKRFIIANYAAQRINDTLQNTSFGNWANYADHVEVDAWTMSGTPIKRVDRISTEPETGYPSWYAAQLSPGVSSLVTSSTVKAMAGKTYEVSVWSQTAWNCTDCGIVGVEIYDSNDKNISDIAQDCGTYDGKYDMRYTYIKNVNTIEYVKSSFDCQLPSNASSMKVKIGFIKSSWVPWNFDDAWVKIKG